MTTRETLTTILADLDAFYCDPALDVLYISVFEDSEDIEELEALFDFIGAHSDIGWCSHTDCFGLPTGREVCTLHGLTVEWVWESLE